MKNYVEIKLIIEQNLLNDSITYYKFLIPIFRKLDCEFKVQIDHDTKYTEFMTDLTNSGFVNTFEYLKTKLIPTDFDQVKVYFESVDMQFKSVLASIYQTLEQIQTSVGDQELYLKEIQSWQGKVYQDFFEKIKKLLARFVIPKLVKLILKTNSEQLKEALFQHQINEFFFELKNKLSEISSELLAVSLNKIYDQYGLNTHLEDLIVDETWNDPFTDFNQFNLIQVVDVNSALKLFNLTKKAKLKEIQHVYKQLAKQYHPDSHSKMANGKMMEQINIAYQILKNEYQDK